MSSGELHGAGGERRHFATTQWSVVIAAGNAQRPDAREALAQLCEAYWYPLYAYVRRRVPSTHEANDLTQAFFAHLLEKEAIAKAQPERGRFRAFLLAAFKNFLANEWNKERAEKRGGGRAELALDFSKGDSRYQIEPAHELTPEKLYERRWVTTLLEQVLARLRLELKESGKEAHFDELKTALLGEASAEEYERAGAALGISPAAAKQAAYRLRKRYRELLRAEVARTVAHEDEIDAEIGRLFESLG
jgi:RNA polymerase sigma factor (sigma-70 family)